MSALETAERQRQPAFGEIGRQAEAHHALDRAAAQRHDRLVVQLQDPAGIGQHDVAGLGRDQAPPLLAEQGLADLLFQLADLLADRRLRAADLFSRPVEAAELLRRHQRAQHIHIEVERGHSSFSRN